MAGERSRRLTFLNRVPCFQHPSPGCSIPNPAVMADPRQQKQEASPASKGRGGQVVVELCEVNESGLVFWSRHRFEVAAELQLRIHRDALPARMRSPEQADGACWVCARGFVIECVPIRRPGGTVAFRVSLVLEAALAALSPGHRSAGEPLSPALRRLDHEGWRLFGLN